MFRALPATDLSDAHPDALLLAPLFASYGGHVPLHGSASTFHIEDANLLVRSAEEESGGSRILVVDNGGPVNCAGLGGMPAQFGAAQLAALPTGVCAPAPLCARSPLPAQRQAWSGRDTRRWPSRE